MKTIENDTRDFSGLAFGLIMPLMSELLDRKTQSSAELDVILTKLVRGYAR
jgi:hypothetical protein